MGTDVGVEATQEEGTTIQLAYPGAQAIEDAGKFHRDIAAAYDCQALGKLFEVEHLVGADGMFAAGKFRDMWPAASGYQDPFCRIAPLADRHRMGIDDP